MQKIYGCTLLGASGISLIFSRLYTHTFNQGRLNTWSLDDELSTRELFPYPPSHSIKHSNNNMECNGHTPCGLLLHKNASLTNVDGSTDQTHTCESLQI